MSRFLKVKLLNLETLFSKVQFCEETESANILALEEYGSGTQSETQENYKRIFLKTLLTQHQDILSTIFVSGSVQWCKIVDSMISLIIIGEVWLITIVTLIKSESIQYFATWKSTGVKQLGIYADVINHKKKLTTIKRDITVQWYMFCYLQAIGNKFF